MIKISVIVCTFSPRASYIERVLHALRNQSLPRSEWELLIVDASREPAASKWDISWHPNTRYCFEGNSGIESAHSRGIREAGAELLVFLYDDVVLNADYLSAAIQVGNEWPRLGVWGSGAAGLECEKEPPGHLQMFLPLLGFRDNKLPRWGNVVTSLETRPSEAGLCVRRSVAEAYGARSVASAAHTSNRLDPLQLDIQEEGLFYASCSVGLGVGVFPALRLTRLIPGEYLTESHLLRLHENRSVSRHLLDQKWHGTVIEPLSPLGLLEAAKNIVLHRGLERRMYISNFRAALKARRLIAADRSTAGHLAA